MKKLIYPACFYPQSDNDRRYTVVVPDLPGCVTEGSTLEEAIEMATDASSGWVLDELEENHPIPKASNFRSIVPDSPDGFVNLLVLDLDTYADNGNCFQIYVP